MIFSSCQQSLLSGLIQILVGVFPKHDSLFLELKRFLRLLAATPTSAAGLAGGPGSGCSAWMCWGGGGHTMSSIEDLRGSETISKPPHSSSFCFRNILFQRWSLANICFSGLTSYFMAPSPLEQKLFSSSHPWKKLL